MRPEVRVLFAALCMSVLLPETATAQILAQKCGVDSRNPSQAEARLNWARRCALTTHLISPGAYFDTGSPAANGGTLKEYLEDSTSSNSFGRNAYTGQDSGFNINTWFINRLYNSGTIYQGQDANDYYEWWRPVSRKKALPLYPLYGSHYDIYASGTQQLFPHPQLANCSFYLDANGATLAVGYNFYILGYCQPVPSPDRCTVDRLSAREARERIEWARQCGLRQNVGNPSAWFDTGQLSLDQSTNLRDYTEASAPENRRFSGSATGHEINAAYVFSLYKSGVSAYQAPDSQGYYKWGRDPSLLRQRPLYPIFGTSPDINSGSLLIPGSGSDCNLYSGTTAVTSFYVNKYCESIY